jgi:flavodoxin
VKTGAHYIDSFIFFVGEFPFMQALIVYYSRTGHTKKVGDDLAKALPGDVDEIVDTANRAGPVGWLMSGREGTGKKLAKIQPAKKDPAGYDIVVIGTPIWASSMSSPVRTYLAENKAKFKNVAFFCTESTKGSENAFAEMGEIIGKKPKATLTITMADLKGGSDADKVKKFAGEIKA